MGTQDISVIVLITKDYSYGIIEEVTRDYGVIVIHGQKTEKFVHACPTTTTHLGAGKMTHIAGDFGRPRNNSSVTAKDVVKDFFSSCSLHSPS